MLFLGMSGVATINSGIFTNALSKQTELSTLSSGTLVSVYPENITATELNQNVSVAIIIENVVDLYALDIQFKWDPTVLHCVDYTMTMPVDDYPDPVPPSPYAGILYSGFQIQNVVDETGNIPNAEPDTLGEWSYTSMGSLAFNGDGTVVVLTFQVLSLAAGCDLEFPIGADQSPCVMLAYVGGNNIIPDVRNGHFTVGEPKADFTYWPDVGVVDKPVIFNASATENASNIEKYIWDFNVDEEVPVNTTIPTASHNYTAADDYTVSLRVVDANGKISSITRKSIKVVAYRDVVISSVSVAASSICVNETTVVTVRVKNNVLVGMANENCTLKAYYNTSAVDWNDISAANWTLIDTRNLTLAPGPSTSELFDWNTTGILILEANYYVMANLTLVPYERNVTDNTGWTLNPSFITAERIHDLTVEKLGFTAVSADRTFGLPVIAGENARITVTVRNNGTVSEKIFNVKLYSNNSLLETWNIKENLNVNKEKLLSYIWEETSERGYYNITAQVTVADDNRTYNDRLEDYLKVIKTPQLHVNWTPETPVVNGTITLDASNSTHMDPEGNITEYIWNIYPPTEEGLASVSGIADELNGVTVSYEFGARAGNWTVVLQVTDDFGITYSASRTASRNYQESFEITVQGRGGIPFEYIIAIVIVVIVVAVALVIFYRRRRTAET
jgi:PKD repeat protein